MEAAAVALRPATADDVERLRRIEVEAGQLFRDIGLDAIADDDPPAAALLLRHVAEGTAWVATMAVAPAAAAADAVSGTTHDAHPPVASVGGIDGGGSGGGDDERGTSDPAPSSPAVVSQPPREMRRWVIGYALASIVDGEGHLDQISVAPCAGKRGAGRLLVRKVCAWAVARGLRTLTLTTFRDVAWNGPWYRRLGFEEIPGTASPSPVDEVSGDCDGDDHAAGDNSAGGDAGANGGLGSGGGGGGSSSSLKDARPPSAAAPAAREVVAAHGCGLGLLAIRRAEREAGLDALPRVAMRKRLVTGLAGATVAQRHGPAAVQLPEEPE